MSYKCHNFCNGEVLNADPLNEMEQAIVDLENRYHNAVIIIPEHGNEISVADASESPFVGMTIFGKTTQNGTPTPEAPVPLVSVGNGGNISVTVAAAEESQTLEVYTTADGLPGIPVDDGWISDEIDLGRGVYVQRVNKIVLTGAENWLTANTIGGVNILYLQPNYPLAAAEAGLCTHFPYDHAKAYGGQDGYIGAEVRNAAGKSRLWVSTTMTAAEFKSFLAENPVTVLYPMAEPVEIALDSDLMAEFATLHSYKPSTAVSNDAGADMKIEYVADTQTYVENHGGTVDLTGYATEQWVQQGFQPKGEYLTRVPDGYAKDEDIPKKPEDIGAQPAGNYALKNEIPSVPVQSVNGKTGTVSLTAADVKARSENWMPTAQDVGALPSTYTPPNQTAEQVGADPKGTAANAVSQHNTDEDSHNDIRLALQSINARLTAFFDSDDQTLDELSEIVAYITSNKSLIDAITTSKVNVADIINNLTTNVSNKPLSAAQGVVLKGLIDTLAGNLSNYQPKGEYALASQLPTKVSQLQNDSGYLTQHQDISGLLPRTELPAAVNDALAQAAASGAFDGKDGRGVKSITRTAGNGAAGTTDTYTITYTDNTTSTFSVYNGKNGTNGTSVTVKSVSESSADGGSNVVEFSDGKTLRVYNGKAGTPGKSPVRGTDYWTPADQEAMVQDVLAALRTPVFGTVDANKVITLTGALADGTYTFQYEDEDGATHPLGSYTKEPEPTYTNILPLSIDADGSVFNGTGYMDGYRLSSNYNTNAPHYASAQSGYFTTGFFPYTIDDCFACVPFYVKGVNLETIADYVRMAMYTDHTATYNNAHTANLNATGTTGFTITKLGDQYYKITPNSGAYTTGGTSSGWPSKNVTVARLSLPGSGAGVILTINEPID